METLLPYTTTIIYPTDRKNNGEGWDGDVSNFTRSYTNSLLKKNNWDIINSPNHLCNKVNRLH